MSEALDKIQAALDRLTRRWWFYVLLLVVFFLPLSAEKSYDPRQTSAVIAEVMPNGIIYSLPVLWPAFKVIPLLLLAALVFLRQRVARVFAIYVALLSVLLPFGQSIAHTPHYGLVIMWGNLVLYLVVALFWAWEAAAGRNDFSAVRPNWRRFWVAPLAALAFWFPANTAGPVPRPDFSPLLLLANEAGLTYCLITPVFLAVLVLAHPRVNRPVMRAAAFAGLLTGLMNVLQWFILMPAAWWMGVLHLPLVLISAFALVLAGRGESREARLKIADGAGLKAER